MAKNVEAARQLNIDATRIVCEEAGVYFCITQRPVVRSTVCLFLGWGFW